MASFGIASTIFEFLADPVRTSIELPHMTPADRKSVKTLLQQHPEIQCESYGFGEERQLHLFKTHASAEICSTERSGLTHASLAKMSSEDSRDCSTAAPSETSSEPRKDSVAGDSPPSSPREIAFQAAREMIQVRNTFIHVHIESAAIDERVVQSMPHNMFSQCIAVESSAQRDPTPALEPEVKPTAGPFQMEAQAGQHASLTLGALVVVEGLVKVPAFNGHSALVDSWDEETGRYNIVIASAAAPGGCLWAKIKEENLRVVLPHP